MDAEFKKKKQNKKKKNIYIKKSRLKLFTYSEHNILFKGHDLNMTQKRKKSWNIFSHFIFVFRYI
ncbi:hypothetical protein KUTeg_017103 [Tegillarca granosa]|uniref:Uncharacterized protein n=1 Tax=Tegillarca granosa TaxID=220873 RepID=A0ABQ9EMS5_TEGGR|nr:hypothetical protein KUTeg_017103 [Tegillarca granosa]